MSKGGLPPHVTGISPNEGSPGTKLTIRGENFGRSASDLTHVFINQIDVGPTAQWFSSKHISAITPLGEGELEIVVVTNGDKFGTASVSYHQTVKRSVPPQTSVPYWPADERRHCPAIYEHGHQAGREGSSGSTGTSTTGGDLDPSTGLPMSERARISIPISDADLRDIYPVSGSVQLTDKDFDPMLFLLKFYKNCSASDLTVTYNNFRKSLQPDGPSEPVNVIRTNLVLIFRCLSGMESLRIKLLSEKTVDRNQYELPVEAALSDSRNLGHQLFEGILKRRDRAESTRNAIGVMQRYQFLFNLPHAIRANIAKGDYNLVLNDYLRAKSLFSNSDVPVLKRVYGDVDDVISKFRSLLREQLNTMPIEFDDAKRKISYLIQLEVDFDPTYDCLMKFKGWLVEQAHNYQRNFRELSGLSAGSDSASLAIRVVTDPATRMDGRNPMFDFVKSICDLFVLHVVQFWRLGAIYVSGQYSNFHHLEETDSPLPSPSQRNSDDLKNFSSDPEAAWTQINLELVYILANTLRDQILEAVGACSKSAPAVDWLPQCITEFRRCCTALPLNEVSPEINEVFSSLAHDLRRHAVRAIFQYAQNAIESLQLKETWDTDLNDSKGGITKLPSMYEAIMSDAFNCCGDQVLPQTAVEKPLFDSAEIQERFPDWCGDAIVAFISTLRRLADQIENTVPRKRGIPTEFDALTEEDPVDADFACDHASIIVQARGLLLLLNNAESVNDVTNRRLLAAYKSAGYPSTDKLHSRLNNAWKGAILALISRYVKLRGPWLTAPMQSLFTEFPLRVPSNSDKKLCVSGAHIAVRCTLANVAHVYSEVVLLLGTGTLLQLQENRISSETPSGSIHLILVQIVTTLIEQICHYCGKLKFQNMSRRDQVQLLLDLRTIKSILPKTLFTPDSSQKLETLCSAIRAAGSATGLDADEKRYFEKLLDREKSRFRLLIDSLSILEPQSTVIIVRG